MLWTGMVRVGDFVLNQEVAQKRGRLFVRMTPASPCQTHEPANAVAVEWDRNNDFIVSIVDWPHAPGNTRFAFSLLLILATFSPTFGGTN